MSTLYRLIRCGAKLCTNGRVPALWGGVMGARTAVCLSCSGKGWVYEPVVPNPLDEIERLQAALRTIAESEPAAGYVSEYDRHHISGADCDGCIELIELAKKVLKERPLTIIPPLA